jgi:hypothetical protein
MIPYTNDELFESEVDICDDDDDGDLQYSDSSSIETESDEDGSEHENIAAIIENDDDILEPTEIAEL